jgi:2,5-diketo-D-gluconate reductase A
MSSVPEVRLNNGVQIPQLGFGVFQVPPGDTRDTVAAALDAGYRLIDTAAAYGNEEGVGAALSASGIDRAELFVTTKLGNGDHGGDRARPALEASLERLGLDAVDLYLIHWPIPSQDLYVETWQALEEAYRDGLARAIGVSNFTEHHLGRLRAQTTVAPAVDQVELHPGFAQEGLRGYLREHGIVTEAWSPLGQGGLLEHPVVTQVAGQLGRTPAQVVLRWHLQLGNVVIPKSVTPERITANIDVFDFELDGDQMAALSALEAGGRMGPDPDTFGG